MRGVDVATIVPSARDLLQAIATRRKSLAVVALVAGDHLPEQAARLDDAGVRAFAGASAEVIVALEHATRSVPVLWIEPVRDRDAALAARFHGADGACIAPDLETAAWAEVAEALRSTHMLPVAVASSAAELEVARVAGARAVLLRAGTVERALALAAAAPAGLTLIADAGDQDLDALRALRGHVDAVLVPDTLHSETTFVNFVSDVESLSAFGRARSVAPRRGRGRVAGWSTSTPSAAPPPRRCSSTRAPTSAPSWSRARIG